MLLLAYLKNQADFFFLSVRANPECQHYFRTRNFPGSLPGISPPGNFLVVLGYPLLHLSIPFQLLSSNSISPHSFCSHRADHQRTTKPQRILIWQVLGKSPNSREKVTFLCLLFKNFLNLILLFIYLFFFLRQKGTWLQKHKQYLTVCGRLSCQNKLMCFTGCLFCDIDSLWQLLYCQSKRIPEKCQCTAVKGGLMLGLGEFLTVQGRPAWRPWLAIISHCELRDGQLKASESCRDGGLGDGLCLQGKWMNITLF
jgi:hypothetical protein